MKRSDLALTIHSLPGQWRRTEKNAEIAHPLHLAHLGNGNTNTGTKLEELFPKEILTVLEVEPNTPLPTMCVFIAENC